MNGFVISGEGLKPARPWGEIPLFNLIDGYKLLFFCDEHGAGVLGIEGFKIVGDKRVPDMDYIADFLL